MPNFRYRALTQNGEIVNGTLSAPTAAEVARRIEYLRLLPIETVEDRKAAVATGSSFGFFGRPSPAEVTTFTRDLALLLKASARLDDALELLAVSDVDCVMSVSEVPHVLNPEELLSVENGLVRSYLPYRTMDTRCLRGEQSPVYVQNGLVYAFRIASVLEHRSLYGKKVLPLVTSWEDFLDIDTLEDLRAAELRLSRA